MAPPARGASVLEATKSGTPIPAAKPLSKAVVFTTSGLGGILGWIVVHPFNTLAVRMNLSAGAGPPKSFGVFATELVKAEGVGGVYRGAVANYLRFGPYCVLVFVFVEQGRLMCRRLAP